MKSKLMVLNKRLMKARFGDNKDELTKLVLLTLKGEFENKSKSSDKSDDELIESIAKKMIKSSESIGTEAAKREIKILSDFAPAMMSENEIRENLKSLIDKNPGKPFGFYMGMIMKAGSVDGNVAKKIVNEMLK